MTALGARDDTESTRVNGPAAVVSRTDTMRAPERNVTDDAAEETRSSFNHSALMLDWIDAICAGVTSALSQAVRS